jgi:hypothetical protein
MASGPTIRLLESTDMDGLYAFERYVNGWPPSLTAFEVLALHDHESISITHREIKAEGFFTGSDLRAHEVTLDLKAKPGDLFKFNKEGVPIAGEVSFAEAQYDGVDTFRFKNIAAPPCGSV